MASVSHSYEPVSLLVIANPNQQSRQIGIIASLGCWEVHCAGTAWEAANEIHHKAIDAAVIDFEVGREEATIIARALRRRPNGLLIAIVALVSKDGITAGVSDLVFDEILTKPVDPIRTLDTIAGLVKQSRKR